VTHVHINEIILGFWYFYCKGFLIVWHFTFSEWCWTYSWNRSAYWETTWNDWIQRKWGAFSHEKGMLLLDNFLF